MTQFSLLTCSLGHVLISIDFNQLYNKKETDIYLKWPLFFERFFATASQRNINKASDLTTFLTEDLSDHSKNLTQILLLPYIFPPHGSCAYKKGNKKYFYKPTISECQKSLIVHAKFAIYNVFIKKKLKMQYRDR